MILGFTGTSRGMTPHQLDTLWWLLNRLRLTELHHGDCVGADDQAHHMALTGYGRIAWEPRRVVIHPPRDKRMRAYCRAPGYGYDVVVRKPYNYLTRNRHIVRDGVSGLLAAPRQMAQPASLRGEGTWTTIGYARQARRYIWIIYPDGLYKEEQP